MFVAFLDSMQWFSLSLFHCYTSSRLFLWFLTSSHLFPVPLIIIFSVFKPSVPSVNVSLDCVVSMFLVFINTGSLFLVHSYISWGIFTTCYPDIVVKCHFFSFFFINFIFYLLYFYDSFSF